MNLVLLEDLSAVDATLSQLDHGSSVRVESYDKDKRSKLKKLSQQQIKREEVVQRRNLLAKQRKETRLRIRTDLERC